MDANTEATVRTLVSVIRSQRRRLQTGLQLRETLHDALSRGEDPDHYRVVWLKESIKRVFHTLEDIARDFNASHPDDRCSTQDLADILVSSLATMKSMCDGDG